MDGDTTNLATHSRNLARVDSGPHLKPLVDCSRADEARTTKCPCWGVEDGHEPIACGVDNAPAEPLHLRFCGLMVHRE